MGPRTLPAVHDLDHIHGHGEVLDGDEARDDEKLDAEVEVRRQLALAQIRQYGDSALRLTAREVTEFDDDLKRLVDRMAIVGDRVTNARVGDFLD